jgi:hypothetical protein
MEVFILPDRYAPAQSHPKAKLLSPFINIQAADHNARLLYQSRVCAELSPTRFHELVIRSASVLFVLNTRS